ncbi:MAG TPA: M14 family metallocarboxypeptidase [Candidatus Acidoferrum sp.]|nr:M14 family metallocarboxypeptidase [Candidatus Acidoferrum sp.]
MKRLGNNVRGYSGELIHIGAVLDDCLDAAHAHGWNVEDIHAETNTLGLSRRAAPGALAPPRLYISTGIHGDEPAGPLAARDLLRQNAWPAGLELWLCPCLNPAGFILNRRENAQGIDLNRDYLNPQSPATAAHIAWLKRQPPFDLCLCLHEDWESHGFYLYEQNPDAQPSLAEGILEAVAKACPIDLSETIEGWPAQRGALRPKLDPASRPKWPEALFLITHKTRLSYTLEAPSDFPLSARVAALVAGVNAAIGRLARRRAPQLSTEPG